MEIIDPPRRYKGFYWLWIKYRVSANAPWCYGETNISSPEAEGHQVADFVNRLMATEWCVVDMPPRWFLLMHTRRMMEKAIYTSGCHERAKEHLELTAMG